MDPTGFFLNAGRQPCRDSTDRIGHLALSALAAGLVLILIGAGLPLVLGTQAQRAYQELLGAAGEVLPGATVVFSRYDRGWLRSTANTEWALAASGTQRLRLDSRIEQGPTTWFSREGFPVIARVQTRAEWIGTAVQLPPLLVTTHLSTDGSAVGRLLVPATDQPRRDDSPWLRNTDLTGTVHFSPATPTVLIELDLPAAALVTPTGPLAQLTDARLRSDLRGWIGGLYTGTTRLTVGAARFGGTGAAPANASSTATEPRRERRPTGSPDRPPTAPAGAALHGLAIDLTQTPSDRTLDIQLQARVDDLQLRGQDYRAAQVGISARSLEGESLIDLIEAIQALSSNTRTPALRGLVGLTLVTRLLPRFLATGPRFDLDPVRLDTPEGPVNLHLRVAAPAAGNGSVNRGSNAVTWLTAITADGAVTLPESVARDWLGPADQEHRGPTEQRLDRWLEEGWVSARDGQVNSTVRLADGVLIVNGRVLPLLGPTGGFR